MADSDALTRVKNLTSNIFKIAVDTPSSANDNNYSNEQVESRIQGIAALVVIPIFREANYETPTDYPTTDFSSVEIEAAQINEMIARLTAWELLRDDLVEVNFDTRQHLWELNKEAKNLLERIRTGKHTFDGITKLTSKKSFCAPIMDVPERIITDLGNKERTYFDTDTVEDEFDSRDTLGT